MRRFPTSMIAMTVVLLVVVASDLATRSTPGRASETHSSVNSRSAAPAAAAELQAQVKALQDLVPDQAAIMTHVAYHFTNLWFAAQKENWPLADFYLGETRNNLKWAVRAKPIRKNQQGMVVNLEGIREAFDNTQLSQLKQAIEHKDRARFTTLYKESLTVCYSCHQASEKPFLRPQVPAMPEVQIINFDPRATWPQ